MAWGDFILGFVAGLTLTLFAFLVLNMYLETRGLKGR